MKLNLSTDYEDYKSKVKDLRKSLDKCMETGCIEEGFKEELRELMEIEKTLLMEMLPYYRLYDEKAGQASLELIPLEIVGGFNFNSILQSIVRINKNLFLANAIDGKVQFFYIDNLKEDKKVVEWSPEIKEINERISNMHKLNNNEILLLGVKGGAYLISSEKFSKLPNIGEDIKVARVKVNHRLDKFRGFGKSISLSKGLFLTDLGEGRLNLFNLRQKRGGYTIEIYMEGHCPVQGMTSMVKINNNSFAIGRGDGKVYLVEYINNEFKILKEINVIENKIRKIIYLESNGENKDSLIIIGDKGQVSCYLVYEDKLKDIGKLEGNLFEIAINKDKAIVLSEDGIVYLLEETFGSWKLNKEAYIKDRFFIHASSMNEFRYLLMDIRGNLYFLNIKGVYSWEDLWEMPIYQ
ncbi:MAG: hypothetical protein GX366_02615 [Epulopiscium sp.]|nr:hypothetical protein [Candidatus Epulonipiscium sp.]